MGKALLILNVFVALSMLVFTSAYEVTAADVARLKEVYPNLNVTALLALPPDYFEHEGTVDEQLPTFAPCPSIPIPPDTANVSNLRPGNIKVVMSMGDSIAAAMSAKDTSLFSLKEYRGIAYSIGGDQGVITVPNFLKSYALPGYPIGFSTGIGKRESAGNGLNGAVSGAVNQDMLGQAQWLVQQLKANPNINIASDWKVLTLWIGSNNLCDVCSNQADNNGANFQTHVTAALEYIYANVPRVFVNLVANLEISTLHNIGGGACSFIHSIVCGCVGTSNSADRAAVQQAGKDYQANAYKIAQNFNSRNNPGFAVVVQPFLINTLIADRNQLSQADCFHPSAPSHATAAVALWNNMLTPAAQKKTAWNPSDAPLCPTSATLLSTV